MFTIDGKDISATRGDIVFFNVTAADDGVPYLFQQGALLRMKIFEKKGCDNVVLQKDFPVLEDAEQVEVFLSEEDTKIGESINKPKDYWYEIELNTPSGPQTIVGYDEDGPAVFRLLPEGGEGDSKEETEL